MAKRADYAISKASRDVDCKLFTSFFIYADEGDKLSVEGGCDRNWVVQMQRLGKTFATDSYAGMLGLVLPGHPDYGTTSVRQGLYPERLYDNFSSGYAVIKDFTQSRKKFQEYWELAFKRRNSDAGKRINSRPQMQRNTCE